MAIQTIRSVATVSFTGELSLDCLADYSQAVRLRLSEAGVDVGGYNLAPFDPDGDVPGNGFLAHIFDRPGGTLLATGTAVMRGARATRSYTMGTVPVIGATPTTLPGLLFQYVKQNDPDTAPAITVQIYKFNVASAAPTVANEIRIGANPADTIDSLVSAINGSFGYGDGTVGFGTTESTELFAVRTGATQFRIESRQGGLVGNRTTIDADFYTNGTAPPATTNISPGTSETLTGATGYEGIEIQFDSAALPNTLVTSPNVARHCHLEVFGLDLNDNPTKVITGPALLHASSVVLPAP